MKSRFLSSLTKPAGNYALIAEIKLKSPAEGILAIENQVAEIAGQYRKTGVDALSVVTEKKLFAGNLNLVKTVKKICRLPLLCKDFVTEKRQLSAIANAGADAVLLLARLLEAGQLESLVLTAQKLKLTPVVEADNFTDLEQVIAGNFPLVAVNARNLTDFTVDRDRACRMLRMIPDHQIKLAFSGVRNEGDIKNYLKCGAAGILIGTLLIKSPNRIELIRKFKNL